MKRTRTIFRELKNYIFLQRVLRKASKSKDPESLWNVYKLRKNWYGRVYTVVSLREEETGEEELVKSWFAMERMRPINDYLMSLGLTEIVFPSIEKIPDSRSYLVVYSPLFRETTMMWFVWRTVLVAALVTALFLAKKFVF